MGFFDFLAILVRAIVFIVVLVIIIDLYQKRQARLAQERYFESQKPRILEAMELLDHARNQIPVLVSKRVSSTDLINAMEHEMNCVVAGCRMKFGDYVTRMALLNLGMDQYVYQSTHPAFKALLGTRF